MNCYAGTIVSIFLLVIIASRMQVQADPGDLKNGVAKIEVQNVIISSQAQVDAFKISDIKGNLVIRGKDIRNLDGLRSIRSVEGSLTILNNPLLASLKGLSSLTTVGKTFLGGNIIISNNKLLTNAGLPALQIIYGGLYISKNDKLINLEGFGALTAVSSLEIVQNKALKNIKGFSSLSDIGPKAKGLPMLMSTLIIKENDALLNIDGLSALKQITAGLYGIVSIEKNENLRHIDGLRSLKSIGGKLSSLNISNNKRLQHIDGLSGLTSMGKLSSVTLRKNPSLTRCCGLFNLLSTAKPIVKISGNGAGCSEKDILNNGKCTVVCHESIVLSSQLQVDAFPTAYGCNEIKGSLTISGTDIAQVDGLISVTKISGSLSIMDNPALTSLNGLSELALVGQGNKNGDVTISHNTLLQNLDGLSGLKKISNQLAIADNKTLEQIDALSSLEEVNGLKIFNNPALRSINGLHALQKVRTGRYGEFSIINNDALTELSGLSGIQSIEGSKMTIEGSKMTIKISGNDQLFDLEGLSGLRSVSSTGPVHFEISDNAVLNSLYGLRLFYRMDSPHSKLIIKNNPILNACCGLYNLLFNDRPETLQITDNANGCTVNDIISQGRCGGLCANIELKTQSEVDAFPQLYGCTDALNLIVEGQDIRNVDGLVSLSSLGGSMHIRNNPVLSDIDGLSSLTSVGGFTPVDEINISDNRRLTNIDGLSSLSILFGSLHFDNNNALRNVDGLSSLHEIFGDVVISNNRSLLDVNGLSGVNAIYTGRHLSGLSLINNDGLTNINGLAATTRISGYRAFLKIIDNDRLTNVDGLSALTSLDGFIQVRIQILDNDRLRNLDGLSSLHASGPVFNELSITNNAVLNLCCGIYNVASNVDPTVVNISGNGPVCTFDEIVREGGPCLVAAKHPEDMVNSRSPQDLHLYPNPSQGRFDLSIEGETASAYRLVIKDFAGNSVREAIIVRENGNSQFNIDLRPLPRGIYMVSVHDKDKVVATERLVVTE